MQYATEFYEKGYDNVYLLNGGIEGFAQETEGLLEGKKVPEFHKKMEEPKKFTKKKWLEYEFMFSQSALIKSESFFRLTSSISRSFSLRLMRSVSIYAKSMTNNAICS